MAAGWSPAVGTQLLTDTSVLAEAKLSQERAHYLVVEIIFTYPRVSRGSWLILPLIFLQW